MTVRENIELAITSGKRGDALAAEIRTVSETYGLELDPERDVFSLSVGERQRVEIVRCLLQSPRLLIMDEPTSVLTPQESEKVVRRVTKTCRPRMCSPLHQSTSSKKFRFYVITRRFFGRVKSSHSATQQRRALEVLQK